MMKKLTSLLMAFAVFMTFTTHGESINELNPIEKLTIKSERFPQGITLNVTLPADYHKNTDKKYVVLFDLHPRSQPMLAGMHDWMSHNGEWPWLNTIIVTNSWVYNEQLNSYHEQAIAGESETLLDFFEHDLLAQLDKKYRTNGFRIFNGFTSNGTLALYTLLNRPEIFHAYVAASPLLANDNMAIVSTAKDKLSRLKQPRFLFLSTGKSGYEKSHLAAFSKLAKMFNTHQFANLETVTKRFDDHYYMTQPVVAISHAIEHIFKDIHQDLAPTSEVAEQGSKAIIDHYQYLSTEKFGFEVSALNSLTARAFHLMPTDAKQAIDILKTTVAQYPKSAFSYAALAKGYFEQQQFDLAIETQTKAVELSKSLIPWHQRNQQKKLDKYIEAKQ